MSEHEHTQDQVHSGAAVLDIGENVGALLIYCHPHMRGQQIDVSPRERPWERTHTDVLERRVHGKAAYAALFLALTAGTYVIWNQDATPAGTVTISGGQVSELNWQQKPLETVPDSHATGVTDSPEK